MPSYQDEDKESMYGYVLKVSGPCKCLVEEKLGFGEIIKLEGDTASIQCYEETGIRIDKY